MQALVKSRFRPEGSARIADKLSDAEVFIYQFGGKPCAIAYHGKATKPDFYLRFASEAHRERKIREHFEWRRAHARRQAEQRAARSAGGHGCEVGTVFSASWGWEQTNVDFYIVTALVGKNTVELRKLGALDVTDRNAPWMTGKSVPNIDGGPCGPVLRRRTNAKGITSVKINSYVTAFVWDGRPESWTAYA